MSLHRVTDETLWPLGDHLNTNRDLVTYNTGTNTSMVANHLTYDSFGNVADETDDGVDELFLFTGRAFDVDTTLQNNWHRWYDAPTGQWISEDPKGFNANDSNLSRFVGNSPNEHIDPTGLDYSVTAGGAGVTEANRREFITLLRMAIDDLARSGNRLGRAIANALNSSGEGAPRYVITFTQGANASQRTAAGIRQIYLFADLSERDPMTGLRSVPASADFFNGEFPDGNGLTARQRRAVVLAHEFAHAEFGPGFNGTQAGEEATSALVENRIRVALAGEECRRTQYTSPRFNFPIPPGNLPRFDNQNARLERFMDEWAPHEQGH